MMTSLISIACACVFTLHIGAAVDFFLTNGVRVMIDCFTKNEGIE